MITSVKYVDGKYALKSNAVTDEQLIKRCAIDCSPIAEGSSDISIRYLKLVDKVIKLEYIVSEYALCCEIRVLFRDTDGNPHNIVIVLHQRTVYFDNFKFPLYYEDTVDITSSPLTYNFPIGGYPWTTTQELLDARQLYSRQIMSRKYLAKFKGVMYGTSNTTITHYCPIEAGQNISDFVAGKPVFMSGHVYKYVNGSFISSTANDSTDCICSVVINGSYKEFVGVITEVDAENGCIKFASHGDMLFTVDDANLYQIGDVILYNGKILDAEYAMTLRIQQSIVGKVTAKINETTLAIFKS